MVHANPCTMRRAMGMRLGSVWPGIRSHQWASAHYALHNTARAGDETPDRPGLIFDTLSLDWGG